MGEAKRRGAGGIGVRVRTAQDAAKARRQYEALRDSGEVRQAVVVARKRDGTLEVLGQEATPEAALRLLADAARSVVNVMERAGQPMPAERAALKPEPHEEPAGRGEHSGQPMLKVRAVGRDGQGNLKPPFGENFISCGECAHPRWFATFTNADNHPARLVCGHCMNEMLFLPVGPEDA